MANYAGSAHYAQQYAQQLAVVQQQQQQLQQQGAGSEMYSTLLAPFWESQKEEVSQVGKDPAEFKNHQLPLARIKKIMKSDEDVRMISAEAPVLFAKACEMFILELTLRSWAHAEDNRRRTLQRSDVAAAISKNEVFDFLADIVPLDEAAKQEQAAGGAGEDAPSAPSSSAAAAAAVPQGMYGFPYAGTEVAAAAAAAAAVGRGGVVNPALLYQQQPGLVSALPGQQWPAVPVPDAAGDAQ